MRGPGLSARHALTVTIVFFDENDSSEGRPPAASPAHWFLQHTLTPESEFFKVPGRNWGLRIGLFRLPVSSRGGLLVDLQYCLYHNSLVEGTVISSTSTPRNCVSNRWLNHEGHEAKTSVVYRSTSAPVRDQWIGSALFLPSFVVFVTFVVSISPIPIELLSATRA